MFRPTKTFRALENENLGTAFIHYLMALAVFSALWTALFFVVLASAVPRGGFPVLSGPYSNPLYFGGFLFTAGVVFSLFFGALFHIPVSLAGGRQGIERTIRICLYAAMPNLLFGWIPGINLIFSIWTVVLQVIGIRELQKISTLRAVLALLGMLIECLLLIVVFILVIAGIGTSISAVAGPAAISPSGIPTSANDAAFYESCTVPDPVVKARAETILQEHELANRSGNYGAIPPLMDEAGEILGRYEQELAQMPVSDRMADLKTLCILSQQDLGTALRMRGEYARSMQRGDIAGAADLLRRSEGYSFASYFDDDLIAILHNDTHQDGGGPESRTMTFVANYHNYIEASRLISGYGDTAVRTRNWQFALLIANRTRIVADHYDRIFTEYQVAQPFIPFRTEVMGMVEDQRAYADALEQGAGLAMNNSPLSSVYFERATSLDLSAQNHSRKAQALYPLPQ